MKTTKTDSYKKRVVKKFITLKKNMRSVDAASELDVALHKIYNWASAFGMSVKNKNKNNKKTKKTSTKH